VFVVVVVLVCVEEREIVEDSGVFKI